MEEPVGQITHYFGHLGVAAMRLTGPLAVGDQIRAKGHTTDFSQKINSLEIEHQKVDKAGAGDDVAFTATEKARPGDQVFRVQSA